MLFHGHIFCTSIVAGNGIDLLVALIVKAQKDAQIYMLRHDRSNSTVFAINIEMHAIIDSLCCL